MSKCDVRCRETTGRFHCSPGSSLSRQLAFGGRALNELSVMNIVCSLLLDERDGLWHSYHVLFLSRDDGKSWMIYAPWQPTVGMDSFFFFFHHANVHVQPKFDRTVRLPLISVIIRPETMLKPLKPNSLRSLPSLPFLFPPHLLTPSASLSSSSFFHC